MRTYKGVRDSGSTEGALAVQYEEDGKSLNSRVIYIDGAFKEWDQSSDPSDFPPEATAVHVDGDKIRRTSDGADLTAKFNTFLDGLGISRSGEQQQSLGVRAPSGGIPFVGTADPSRWGGANSAFKRMVSRSTTESSAAKY